jgi:hypothetical protein
VIECASCHTLNPDSEKTCLSCRVALSQPEQAGVGFMEQTGSGLAGIARCPAGHPIDPSWKNCPYCERLQASGHAPQLQRSLPLPDSPERASLPQRTRLENNAAPPSSEQSRRTHLAGETSSPESSPLSLSGVPRPTRVEEPGRAQGDRRTALQETLSSPSPPSGLQEPLRTESSPAVSSTPGTSLPVRKLLAVLAAPNLGHGGSIFPVRAGKNVIGADRSNDILLAGDSEVSGQHAIILHRNGAFHLTDRLSTNGTWVNGKEVTANGTVELRDRDHIRCGRTDLVLLMIAPTENSAAGTDDDNSANA